MKEFLKRMRNKVEFYIKHNHFEKKGNNNTIRRANTARFLNCSIMIRGNNNEVIFGEYSNMSGLRILIEGHGNKIIFDNHVTVNATNTQPTVINAIGGKTIYIGEGSLLSNNIEIHTSDYHGIYDEGIRINPDKDIIIGKNVWIGLGCKLLKGTLIGDGCIVGAGSVLSKKYNVDHCILVGNPAVVKREKVYWLGSREDVANIPSVMKEKSNSQT